MAITFRNIKDSALTHTEMDTNLSSYYLSSSVSGSTITFFQSSSVDGSLISSSHDLADSDSQTLNIVGDQLSISNGNTVTVPTGSDTTYTAGEGLTLTGTEFSLTEAHFSGDYDDLLNKPTVGLSLVTNNLTLTKLDGTTDIVDLTPYLDEDARAIASGVLDSVTGIVTFTRDDTTTFTLDLSALLDGSGLVTSVNGFDGVVVLTTDEVAEGSTNLYDKEVTLTGENITINGTYPNFQLTGSNGSVTSVNGQTGDVTLTIPTVPTNVSEFTNDAGYITEDTNTQLSDADIAAFGYIKTYTDTNTQLSDADIAAFGYIKTYTDTNTQLGDADIAAFGYIKTYTDTNTQLSDADIAAFGYIKTYSETDTLQSVTTRGATTSTTITAANFITTSDKRLKSDIKPIQEGLETIKKFVSYEYVKDGVQDAGFLAQEVQEAIPYSIGEREDGFLTMRDRPVLAHMHKAILELEARLAAIEEKLQ